MFLGEKLLASLKTKIEYILTLDAKENSENSLTTRIARHLFPYARKGSQRAFGFKVDLF